ncbi:hypothetical protein OEV82_01395 [Caldibacillus thermolactis]|jgi:hypothetical protein|uniref:Flagellar hook-length control protein FliK n=1 Tax=Pallidibacillus thermolactis TaxID=251051 RepID=A0ABT2WBP7_9BACI|nr:hypothetical protein [Pallidibacillus thermolactis]MCU9593109.1 hypothetical protein [Pallidibacillus thermolactis]MCU9600127.1 hypothetical protein [Pallidibacillus thermolactis subsp. kokeshiiformis]MED1671990.1 hypothetical protein [Pallidibacillus thermolactis subsp. kokeshiiformis]
MHNYQLTSLSHVTNIQNSKLDQFPLQKGQIISGKVLYIDQQNIALLQVNNQKFLAKLEAPIDVLQNYYFQVQETVGKIQLKVLENVTNKESLLTFLQIPNNKKMNRFIQTWLNTNLPINRSIVHKALQWLQVAKNPESVLQIMKFMHQANLPFTNDIFKSLYSFHHGPSITTLLHHLHIQLEHLDQHQLYPLIQSLLGKSNGDLQGVNWGRGDNVHQALLFILNVIGYNAGVQIMNGKDKATTLKWQIMNLLQGDKQLSSNLKILAEQLIFKISGGQLQTINNDSFLQCTVALPIPLPEQVIDAQIQFRGKKDKNGQLNKDYCQIVFDLMLPNIGKLYAYMNVQNRVITIQMKSDLPHLEKVSKGLIAQLKKNLAKHGYTLSTIKFEKFQSQDKINNKHEKLPIYHSFRNVDVKI